MRIAEPTAGRGGGTLDRPTRPLSHPGDSAAPEDLRVVLSKTGIVQVGAGWGMSQTKMPPGGMHRLCRDDPGKASIPSGEKARECPVGNRKQGSVIQRQILSGLGEVVTVNQRQCTWDTQEMVPAVPWEKEHLVLDVVQPPGCNQGFRMLGCCKEDGLATFAKCCRQLAEICWMPVGWGVMATSVNWAQESYPSLSSPCVVKGAIIYLLAFASAATRHLKIVEFLLQSKNASWLLAQQLAFTLSTEDAIWMLGAFLTCVCTEPRVGENCKQCSFETYFGYMLGEEKSIEQVCKQIWLGLFDDRSSAIPDFRDPQKVKEFLQEKYEKKRWYVPPEQAKVVASVHASISGSSASSTSSTPEVKPLKSLLGDSAPALHLNKGTPSQSPVVGRSQGQQQEKKQFDLLSDLGSDIFAAPAPQSTATANFANFAHFNSHAGGSAGSVNANFAHFDNFPKSSSADFGTFSTSQSHQTASAVSKVPASKAGLQTTDKYAALANLDNIFSAGQGGDQGSGFGTTGKAPVGSVVSVPSQSSASSDKYAALAELDSVFSSAATSSNAYTSTSNASSNVFGTVPVGASAQTQPASSSVPAPFGATPSTNPFVAAAGPSVASSTNPFQTNARGATATFGTASMSMPAGFGTPAPYSLPTSFSGSFQQPAFPAQAAFPQQTAFSQQPNEYDDIWKIGRITFTFVMHIIAIAARQLMHLLLTFSVP
ncbi:arf-GAP domain and FG repeats-containing protein 1 isoform 4 [Camelus ferus]|nr:arf-GAP domain and FG repeats-containing protein 1 isoform 4 [Camelus ferus]